MLNGFHGTNLSAASTIVAQGFLPCQSTDGHLGPGIYFFLDELTPAKVCAQRWAEFMEGKKGFVDFAVLKSEISISGSNVLDLRKCDHAMKFHQLKNIYLQKLRDADQLVDVFPRKRDKGHDQYKVAAAVISLSGADMIIGQQYSKVVGDEIEKEFSNPLTCVVSNFTMINVVKKDKIVRTNVSCTKLSGSTWS